MRRRLLIAILAVVGFVTMLVWRLPAKWLVSRIPATSCAEIDGSIWSGSCAGLVVQNTAVGDVQWVLHPAALLTGKLAGHVAFTDGPTAAQADVEARSSSSITLRNLVADIPLDPAAIPRMPPTLGGRAHLDLARLTLVNQAITQLEGRVEVHDLEDRSHGTTQIGSYSLTFPPGATGIPVAQLHDLGGPLSVEGTVRLTLRPGFSGGQYSVEGLVAPRPTAPLELKRNLEPLGSPDAQGRRPFGFEGTF
jgi:general secretion pathway protein N